MTFSIHVGLQRYKYLIMGISSAAEVFHHLIEQVIEGIPGVRNVSDDIIIFRKTRSDHDTSLCLLFQRLSARGLTLHREKCTFNQSAVHFFGFQFSDKCLSAEPANIEAITSLDIPRYADKVLSLLGMTNYCARFVSAPLHRLTCKTDNGEPVKWK